MCAEKNIRGVSSHDAEKVIFVEREMAQILPKKTMSEEYNWEKKGYDQEKLSSAGATLESRKVALFLLDTRVTLAVSNYAFSCYVIINR